MKKLYFIIPLILLITSCETREDINRNKNKSPEVYLSLDKSDNYVKELVDTLKMSESAVYYFKSSDDSNLSLMHSVELEFVDNKLDFKDSVLVSLNEASGELVVENILDSKRITEDTYSFNVYLLATDIYGMSSKAKLTIVLRSNRSAVPNVEFSQISATEYEISAENSIDPDGDEIVAYEYLIDGKIIYNKAGYEGEYETVANPNPGHAGTEGTYIISTPLSSIKHNFQVENVNDFKVYVRVKDSRGLWSSWYQFSL